MAWNEQTKERPSGWSTCREFQQDAYQYGLKSAPGGMSAMRKWELQAEECCSVFDNWRLVPTVRKVEYNLLHIKLACLLATADNASRSPHQAL